MSLILCVCIFPSAGCLILPPCCCFSFFLFCTYRDVFSLSFIFFSSSETELIKIIHMQAVYRSSFDAVVDDADERRLGDFSHFSFRFFFCCSLIWFHFNCFFSCTRQIFRFPLLLFFLSRVARHRCASSSSLSSSRTCFSPSSAQEIHLTRRVL